MRCEAKYVPNDGFNGFTFCHVFHTEENETNSLGEECCVCKCLKVASIQCFCTQND